MKKKNCLLLSSSVISSPLEDIMGIASGRYSKYIIQDRAAGCQRWSEAGATPKNFVCDV